GRREAELVKSFAEVPRDAERVIFFPRAAGGSPERESARGRFVAVLLGLATAALVLTALVWELSRPKLAAGVARARMRARERVRLLFVRDSDRARELDYDPGRERRAEQRARELLRSCVNEQEWAMYRDLGFLRVYGRSGSRYAYLIYPHKPIVAYVPRTETQLSEYCVALPYRSRPYGSARLPDSDDVLAKWMALSADEHGLIADANMHLPGRQVDPERVARDLARLACWESERKGRPEQTAAEEIAESRESEMAGGADGHAPSRAGFPPIVCAPREHRIVCDHAPQRGSDRGSRARSGARVSTRDRLLRGEFGQADRRRGALVDRDDAV